jgi:hypothetical protein
MFIVTCPDQHISWEYFDFGAARIAAEDLTRRYPISKVYLEHGKDPDGAAVVLYSWFNGVIQ